MADVHPQAAERVAAVIALASLAGALVVLVTTSLANLGAVFVMLVGLMVAVLGSWHALTRRGAFRFVATGSVAVGVAILVGGLVWADPSVGWIVVVLLLGVVSAAAARHALRKVTRRQRGPPGPSGCQTGEPRGPDHEFEVRRREGRAIPSRRRVPEVGASSRSSSAPTTTYCSWPRRPSPGVPTSWAWRAATGLRRSSPRWPPATGSPTWWCRPARGTTSRWTSAWTVMTSSVPSTPLPTASTTRSTWPPSTVGSS